MGMQTTRGRVCVSLLAEWSRAGFGDRAFSQSTAEHQTVVAGEDDVHTGPPWAWQACSQAGLPTGEESGLARPLGLALWFPSVTALQEELEAGSVVCSPIGRPYRRGWCLGARGSCEGLEEDEEQEGMEESEAVAAASSASSSSQAWSSWLTLDCRAAGVSHSLGRQLCRKGTQELK